MRPHSRHYLGIARSKLTFGARSCNTVLKLNNFPYKPELLHRLTICMTRGPVSLVGFAVSREKKGKGVGHRVVVVHYGPGAQKPDNNSIKSDYGLGTVG